MLKQFEQMITLNSAFYQTCEAADTLHETCIYGLGHAHAIAGVEACDPLTVLFMLSHTISSL